MASEYQIKFFKGAYNNPLTLSTNNQGGIYFDTNTKQIYVGGVAYGGAITDATFSSSVLTITKADNSTISLDFSDTASAQQTFYVFQHLNSLIGTATENDTLTAEYANTHYLTSAGNLIAADKALDTEIYNLGTRIDNLSTSNVETVTKTVNAENGDTTLTFKGVSETGGVVEVGTRTDNIVLKKVATTGSAVDVAVADTAGVFVGTNVEDVLLEISSKISDSNLSINGQVGQFTTDETMITVDGTHKVLGVNTTGYIGTTANGIDLVADKVDTAGNSADDADLATIKTVKTYIGTEIAALDVTEYAQAEIAADSKSFSVYGIKEVDGKIDKGTSSVTLNFGSVYHATNNKVALVSNITEVIEGLDTTQDVQAVVYTAQSGNDGAKLTFKGVSETNGVIAQGSGTSELTFAKVATTGAAADVTLAAADTPYVGSNVDETIVNVNSRIKALEELPKYDVVVIGTDALPTATATTMHKIYLKSESLTSTGDVYGEYITVRSGSDPNYSYSWEKLGTTAASLDGYVKTIVVNGKSYTVDNGGSSTTVTLHDAITSITHGDSDITTDSAYTDAYIDTAVTVISTKDTTAGTYEAQVTSAAKVKVQAVETSGDNAMGLAEASNVKAYVGTQISNLTFGTTSTGTNVSVAYSETNGLVNIEVTEKYANVTVSTSAEPYLTVTGGAKLAVGSDIEKVKEYTDYKISTVINSLDADVTSTSTAIATVQVVEQNGKITAVNVTTQEARVHYTSASKGNPANLKATSDTGAVIGTDIAAIKSYIDEKATEASTVANANATIPVGTTTETILGTVAGTAITAKASFTWEEYA